MQGRRCQRCAGAVRLDAPVALCPAVHRPEFCTGEELSRKPATNLGLTMALILLGFWALNRSHFDIHSGDFGQETAAAVGEIACGRSEVTILKVAMAERMCDKCLCWSVLRCRVGWVNKRSRF